MANQRHPDKKHFSTWMFEKDAKALRRAAEESGLSMSEFLIELLKLYNKVRKEKPEAVFKRPKQ